MLKQYATLFRRVMIFADLCIITASFFAGYYIRTSFGYIYPLNIYSPLLPLILTIWGFLLYFMGMYRSFRTRTIHELLYIILKSLVFGMIIFGSFLIYSFKTIYISRGLILAIFLSTAALLSLEKIALVLFFRHVRKSGLNYRNILIVGTNKRAQHFIELINQHVEWGFKIIGVIDEDPAKKEDKILGHKIVGRLADIPKIIEHNPVDEVAFIIPRSWLDKIQGTVQFLESIGTKIHLAVDHFDLKFAKASQSSLHGFPMITFESAPNKLGLLLFKRIFDIILSGIALLLFLPLLIIITLLIKLTSKGPVFFIQQRCGLNGRKFNLYKFRTMVKNAEEKLDELRQYNEMKGPVFKMTNDPRLTFMGKFLRKFSLDELPQVWNIFKGDMSLIGPRPPLPQEVKDYDNWQRRRLSMRPGLSCLWQVSGRNKISDFNEWVRLDLEYIDKWSLWLDSKIFFKTIPVVLFGIGSK